MAHGATMLAPHMHTDTHALPSVCGTRQRLKYTRQRPHDKILAGKRVFAECQKKVFAECDTRQRASLPSDRKKTLGKTFNTRQICGFR
jgi:hypothetical protein